MIKISQQGRQIERLVAAKIGRKQDAVLSLQMTPLIDVIFQLLIFFFVTSQFRAVEDYLPFQFPKFPAVGTVGLVEPFVITVSPAGDGCAVSFGDNQKITINSDTAEKDLTLLAEIITGELQKQKRAFSDPIEFAFDSAVKWDYIAKIYNVFFGLGASDITFRMTE
jgi:biopolymer transport protein ExbD